MQDFLKMLSVLTVAGLMGVAFNSTYQHQKPDIVKPVGVLETAKTDNPIIFLGHGSGVFVAPRKFLTAAHVTDDFFKQTASRVRTEDGGLYNVIAVDRDKDMDVAVVTLDRDYIGYIPLLNCKPQKRGVELTTVGNPLSMEFIVSKVRVTGGQRGLEVTQNDNQPEQNEEPKVSPFSGPKGKKFNRIPPDKLNKVVNKEKPITYVGTEFFQGLALPGQSGSPLFDDDGKIVGVISLSVIEQNIGSFTGLGMYVAMSAACDFIEKKKTGFDK